MARHVVPEPPDQHGGGAGSAPTWQASTVVHRSHSPRRRIRSRSAGRSWPSAASMRVPASPSASTTSVAVSAVGARQCDRPAMPVNVNMPLITVTWLGVRPRHERCCGESTPEWAIDEAAVRARALRRLLGSSEARDGRRGRWRCVWSSERAGRGVRPGRWGDGRSVVHSASIRRLGGDQAIRESIGCPQRLMSGREDRGRDVCPTGPPPAAHFAPAALARCQPLCQRLVGSRHVVPVVPVARVAPPPLERRSPSGRPRPLSTSRGTSASSPE